MAWQRSFRLVHLGVAISKLLSCVIAAVLIQRPVIAALREELLLFSLLRSKFYSRMERILSKKITFSGSLNIYINIYSCELMALIHSLNPVGATEGK